MSESKLRAVESCCRLREVADGAGLDAFADPLRRGGVVSDDERFHRHAEVRRPGVRGAQELLDRFLPADDLTSRNIFVDGIGREDGVDALRFMQRPSIIKLVHEPADLVGGGCDSHLISSGAIGPSPFFTPSRIGRGGPFLGIVTSTQSSSPGGRRDGSGICSGMKKAIGWSRIASFSPRRSMNRTWRSAGE